MNSGPKHQNQQQYYYEEENEYYDENNQYYDEGNPEGQGEEYEDYEGDGYDYYNSNQQGGHNDGYPRNSNTNMAQGANKNAFRGSYDEEQRFNNHAGSNNRNRSGQEFRQPYEEPPRRDYQEEQDYDEPLVQQSITETIDANRVKTSKLFQKFLQNENKDNINKPVQQKNAKGNVSPFRQNQGFPPNVPPNQGSKQNQDYSPHQNQYYHPPNNHPQHKDRGLPNYDEQERYEPHHHGRESPVRNNQEYNHDGYRGPNEFEYVQEPRNFDVDLNQNSSSKLVSMQNPEVLTQPFPGFPGPPHQNPPYLMPNPYQFVGYGMNPEMMNPMQHHPQINNPTEIFMLRSQVMELNRALTREVEANKQLDSKCSEYLSQLEKSAQNFEEFKQKLFDQDTGHQEEVRRLEDKIRHLNETLAEKDKTEEQRTTELNKLKRKLDAELESRGRLLEEHDDMERRNLEEIGRIQKELEQKEEEVQRMRRENDATKHDKDGFKASEERFLREIRGLKSEVSELNRANEDLRKTIDDKNQQINLGNIECNSLKNQLATIDGQYRDLLSENDHIKRENFGLKERLLAAESEIKTLQMTLQKTQINADQVSEALSRTEKALERERRLTTELRTQVASEPRRVNQWEASRGYENNDYSWQNRQTEERDQPIPRKDNNEPQGGNREYQFPPTKYELKREVQRPFTAQQETQTRQRQQPEPQNPQRQQPSYVQPEYQRQDYQEPSKTNLSGRAGGGRNWATEENVVVTQATRENKYEVVRNKSPGRRNQPERPSQVNEEPYGRNTVQNSEPPRNQPTSPRSKSTYGPAVPKLTNQNQLYKPTNDLLSWEEPSNESKLVCQRRKSPQRHQGIENKPNNFLAWDEPQTKNRPTTSQWKDGIDRKDVNVDGRKPPRPQDMENKQGNFLAWNDSPVKGQPVNRQLKEERQDENMGGRRPQRAQENEEKSPITMNRKQNQAPNNAGQIFGKDDNKIPQDLQEVKGFENELMTLQMRKDNLNNELQRLDKAKIKSGANIKRKQEVESELSYIQSNISNVKTRLRELNALLPY